MDIKNKKYIQLCICGILGGIFTGAGDWLLGCIPIDVADGNGLFQRAYYLSGAYALWRPVLVVALGIPGAFLYYFGMQAMNSDLLDDYKKLKQVHQYCSILTAVLLLPIHAWTATLSYFTAYLGPRIGKEEALATVTSYQNDFLYAILPMYVPLVSFLLIHFVMLIAGKTKYPRYLLCVHPVVINLVLVTIPDIAQAAGAAPTTWMAVMSQSSTNTSIVLWFLSAAWYESRKGTSPLKR